MNFMQSKNEDIPIFAKKNNNSVIVFFNMESIPNKHLIKSAEIQLIVDRSFNSCSELPVYFNDGIITTDWSFINNCLSGFTICSHDKIQDIDITEKIHIFASGLIENKGLVIEIPEVYVKGIKLRIRYFDNVISPSNCGCFYDKKLYISATSDTTNSPYFFIGNSIKTTFTIKNLSNYNIGVSLFYSSDKENNISESEIIAIEANEIKMIEVEKFCKYAGLTITSRDTSILCEVYFITKL